MTTMGNTVIASTATTRNASTARRALEGRHANGVRQDRFHRAAASTRPAGISTKRPLDIEAALTWAYRHELPKRRDGDDRGPNLGFPKISPMFRHADLGTRVENFSREPGMPAALGEPHPDALVIEAAVLDLARYAGHQFGGDLGLTTYLPAGLDDVAAMTRSMGELVNIAQVFARLGHRPTFAKSPEPTAVVGKTGKVLAFRIRSEMRAGSDGIMRAHLIEEQVTAQGKDRYPTGAYCAIEWDNPKVILRERADYAAWWAGLDLLAHELRGKLETISVLDIAAPQRPWAGEVEIAAPRRVLDAPASRARLREQQENFLVRRILDHRRRQAGRRRPAKPAAAEAATG